jgi:hypothetical protein
MWGIIGAIATFLILNSKNTEGGKKDNNSSKNTEGGTSFLGRTDLSIGLRNNNPLNIHASNIPFKGKVLKPIKSDYDNDGKRIEQFQTFEYGLKAAIEHILTYYNGVPLLTTCYNKSEGKLDTIQKILNRWVCGMNPKDYINFVERETGFNRDKALNLNDKDKMSRLIYAMCLNECGTQYRANILSAANFKKYLSRALTIDK